jgi:hypothetical protein
MESKLFFTEESLDVISNHFPNSLRSNLVFGYASTDNPEFIADDRLENTSYFAANLIWNVYVHTTIGGEYLWGRRENVDGNSGTSNRILFSSKFEF